MRTLIKSLLIAFGLYVVFMIFMYFTGDPLARWVILIIMLPILAGFMFVGWIIGFIIERIKGYKSKRRTYIGWVGLICAIVALFFSWVLPLLFPRYWVISPLPFYWPFWGFIIGALITFIVEIIARKVRKK